MSKTREAPSRRERRHMPDSPRIEDFLSASPLLFNEGTSRSHDLVAPASPVELSPDYVKGHLDELEYTTHLLQSAKDLSERAGKQNYSDSKPTRKRAAVLARHADAIIAGVFDLPKEEDGMPPLELIQWRKSLRDGVAKKAVEASVADREQNVWKRPIVSKSFGPHDPDARERAANDYDREDNTVRV